MPSSNYQLPELFSRNITKFGFRLSNAAISDLSIIGTNTVLSTLQIHSILTLLLYGARGRSAAELMTLVFPEWCSYNSIIKNYRTILELLFNAPGGGDLMKTRKVITFNLNKNVNMEFVKIATEFFYTELIVMRNPTSFIVPVLHIPFHGHGLPLRQPPYMIPSNAAHQPRPLAANLGPFPLRSFSVISSGPSQIYQFNNLASSFNVRNPTKVITMNNTNYNPGCSLNVYIESNTTCKFPTNIKNSMVMENRKYYETSSKQYDVKMLIFNGKFKYGTLGIVGDVIEIPLENNDFSLLILKPFYRWGLNTLQNFVDSEYFRDVKTHMIYKDMHVEMPIFNVRTNTVLNSLLHQIGLQTIFTTGLDLANAFDNAIPAGYNGNLPMAPPSHDVIDNFLVTHKIDFQIDVTGVPYLQNDCDYNNLNTDQNVDMNDINDVNNSASGLNDDVHNFNIDHPFLFVLRWNVFNLSLVIGTIETPIL